MQLLNAPTGHLLQVERILLVPVLDGPKFSGRSSALLDFRSATRSLLAQHLHNLLGLKPGKDIYPAFLTRFSSEAVQTGMDTRRATGGRRRRTRQYVEEPDRAQRSRHARIRRRSRKLLRK